MRGVGVQELRLSGPGVTTKSTHHPAPCSLLTPNLPRAQLAVGERLLQCRLQDSFLISNSHGKHTSKHSNTSWRREQRFKACGFSYYIHPRFCFVFLRYTPILSRVTPPAFLGLGWATATPCRIFVVSKDRQWNVGETGLSRIEHICITNDDIISLAF